MSNLLEKKPILSDAEPPITVEPQNPTQNTDSDVIRVALEVNCCPCPKKDEPKDCKCEDCNCEDCKCEDCKCEEVCGCEKKEGEITFCHRWFPMFSKVSN
jgi:hypothetical protein